MTIFKSTAWPSPYPFVSLWMLFWPNCCHNHSISPPQREDNSHKILHPSLCPYHELFGKAQLYPLPAPSPLIFSISCFQSFSCVLCRIPICLSGDTNCKIAWGFPWAATPIGSLLISGNVRRLVERLVTGKLCLSPSVLLSQMSYLRPLEKGAPSFFSLWLFPFQGLPQQITIFHLNLFFVYLLLWPELQYLMDQQHFVESEDSKRL